MKRRRVFLIALASALLGGLLGACQDGRTPSPPHRVPKPKVAHEAAHPIKTVQVAQGRLTEA